MKLEEFLINEDKRTDFLETASALGVISSRELDQACREIINLKPSQQKQVDLENLLFLIKSEVGAGNYDWNPSGVSQIKSLTTDDLYSIIDVCALEVGMKDFMNAVGYKIVGNNPYFIHNNINKYYSAERERFGEIKGAKANTADIVISNSSAEKTLATILDTSQEVSTDTKRGFVKIDGVNYIQVSLKKSKNDAQLGKIMNFLSKNLGYGVAPSDAVKDLDLFAGSTGEDITENLNIIFEGIVWDKLKGVARKTWDKLKSTVGKLISKFKSKYNKILKKPIPDKDISELFEGISESFIYEAVDRRVPVIVKNVKENLPLIIKRVNDKIDEAIRISQSAKGIVAVPQGKISPTKYIKGDEKTNALSLVANYSTAKTIINMAKDADKIGKTTRRLVAEMLFGGTELPLWKVYGNYGKGKSTYEYLGTIKSFLSKLPEPNIDVFGFSVSPVDTHYNFKLGMLEDISEKGKKYIQLRAGTNSSNRLTHNIEGVLVKGPYPLDYPMEEFLRKK